MKHWKVVIALGFLLVTAVVMAPPAARAQDDWRFGVVEAYEGPDSAEVLNVSWTRVRLHWADVQPDGPDSWEPRVSDALIERELTAGREVVGLLIGIPDWARDEKRLPQGLWLPHDDPDNSWAVFVREVVGRYAGRIDHWIIWNEPDIDPSEIAHTWDGTVDDFYQLQRVAYLVAKEANPAAVIHLSAFTYWADVNAGREQYMARLLDRILADEEAIAHNFYFDVATAHVYFQPGQIYTLIDLFRGIMNDRGLDKPIWLVETNAPPIDDESWPVENWTLSVLQAEQAAFMPQAVAAAFAAGAERVAVYKLKDTRDDRAANPEPFGLVRSDASWRPAFRSYENAVRFLSGFTAVTRDRWDEIGQFTFEQTGRTTTVLFARLPEEQEVEVPALAGQALLVDMYGRARDVKAEDGVYRVRLAAPKCTHTIGDYCMIGGAVFYLVQARDGRRLALGPAPAVTPTATLPATATPTITPTPPATPTPPPSVTPTLAPPATATGAPEAVSESAPTAEATAVVEVTAVVEAPAAPATGARWPVIVGGGLLLVLGGLGAWGILRRRS